MSVSYKKRRVAVVGAGAAGLVTARCLLEEGHDCKVFEQTATTGGQWAFAPHDPQAYSAVYGQCSTYYTLQAVCELKPCIIRAFLHIWF